MKYREKRKQYSEINSELEKKKKEISNFNGQLKVLNKNLEKLKEDLTSTLHFLK